MYRAKQIGSNEEVTAGCFDTENNRIYSAYFDIDRDTLEKCDNKGKWKAVGPKRKPDENGVLPLTPEELEEFTALFFDNKNVVHRVYYDGNCIVVEWKEPDNNEFGQLYLDEVSAILWLAERFELNGGE